MAPVTYGAGDVTACAALVAIVFALVAAVRIRRKTDPKMRFLLDLLDRNLEKDGDENDSNRKP